MVVPNYYWDTCIFIAFLNEERDQYGFHIDHIGQFLEEAAEGKCRIFCSTVTFAEITEQSLKKKNVGSFDDFLSDFKGNVVPFSPDPNIMIEAGQLRSFRFGTGSRAMQTPDAIHLMTAKRIVQDGVRLDAFHTFDGGRRGVSILDFEKECEHLRGTPVIESVVSLPRSRPIHPAPKLRV